MSSMPWLVVTSRRRPAVLDVDLHQPLVQLALAQPLAEFLARALHAFARLGLTAASAGPGSPVLGV